MDFPTIYPVTCHTDHVGVGSTFVAINGFVHKGTDFIDEAVARGATKIVIENASCQDASLQGLSCCFVDDCRRALAELSSAALGHPSKKLKIIGITGTKGKTTTTFLIDHILRSKGYKTAVLGTIENRICDEIVPSERTTPSSDYLHVFFNEALKKGVTHVVMEVSSHSIALQRIHGVSFEAVGFTNLAPEHMDFHPTMEDYFLTKSKLCNQVCVGGSIVVNSDDTFGKRLTGMYSTEQFGKDRFSINKNDLSGLNISFEGTDYDIPSLFGEFNAYNVMMSILITRDLGLTDLEVKESLLSFSHVPGRLQQYRLKNGATAFIDYAHNPSSFDAVLKVLRPLSSHMIVLFGCGGDRDKTKRPVMGKLASQYGDIVIVTEDNPRNEDPNEIFKEIMVGIPKEKMTSCLLIPNRSEAIKKSAELSKNGSIIALLGKGHEDYYLCKGKKYYFSDLEEIKKY